MINLGRWEGEGGSVEPDLPTLEQQFQPNLALSIWAARSATVEVQEQELGGNPLSFLIVVGEVSCSCTVQAACCHRVTVNLNYSACVCVCVCVCVWCIVVHLRWSPMRQKSTSTIPILLGTYCTHACTYL